MSEREEIVPRTTIFGLGLSLVLPLAILTCTSLLFTQHKFLGNIILETGMWSCTIGLLFFITRVEKLPLSSIGLKLPSTQTLVYGVLAYLILILLALATRIVMKLLNIPYDIEDVLKLLLKFPFAWRLVLVFSAAFMEEILFRGYAIERLLPIIKNKWLTGLIPLIAFTVGHSFTQQPGNLIVIFVTGAGFTGIYYWKRDLTINMTAHFIVDFISVIILPAVIDINK